MGGWPAAEGTRVGWEALPREIRSEVEAVCGSRVVGAVSQLSGFSSSVAARLVCANGRRVFVKAAVGERDADSADDHRHEAMILASINALGAPGVPRLLGVVDGTVGVAVVIEDIQARSPTLPWTARDLATVVKGWDRLVDVLTPAPDLWLAEVPGRLGGWRSLAAAPPGEGLDAWSRGHLDELAELEGSWQGAARGCSLLHSDLRADNVLLAVDRVVFVDWAHASCGAAVVDLVLLAPSVTLQGGPSPSDVLGLSHHGAVEIERLRPVVSAWAGYLTERSLRPAPPGFPALRAFQAGQAEITRRWLRDLLS